MKLSTLSRSLLLATVLTLPMLSQAQQIAELFRYNPTASLLSANGLLPATPSAAAAATTFGIGGNYTTFTNNYGGQVAWVGGGLFFLKRPQVAEYLKAKPSTARGYYEITVPVDGKIADNTLFLGATGYQKFALDRKFFEEQGVVFDDQRREAHITLGRPVVKEALLAERSIKPRFDRLQALGDNVYIAYPPGVASINADYVWPVATALKPQGRFHSGNNIIVYGGPRDPMADPRLGGELQRAGIKRVFIGQTGDGEMNGQRVRVINAGTGIIGWVLPITINFKLENPNDFKRAVAAYPVLASALIVEGDTLKANTEVIG